MNQGLTMSRKAEMQTLTILLALALVLLRTCPAMPTTGEDDSEERTTDVRRGRDCLSDEDCPSAEVPSFIKPPAKLTKVAEGQTVTISCQTLGAPKATVTWYKDDTLLTGGRYHFNTNGNLTIEDIVAADAGTYRCTATNKFGAVAESGDLMVRRKTHIQSPPEDLEIIAGQDAKFVCIASTDPNEIGNLRIEWKKDDDFINYALLQRVFKNTHDDSLTISGTIVTDTGRYTCVATNGLDRVEASAYLTVVDKPNPPEIIKVDCAKLSYKNQAEIKWFEKGDNYATIFEYIVQYNTSFTPDMWTTAPAVGTEKEIQQDMKDKMMIIQLSPWANYTFRVIARNRIGASAPSEHSTTVCSTEAAVPDKNPDFVKGEGDQPHNLVIMWSVMPQIEHNGLGFQYVIEWRCEDTKIDCSQDQYYPNLNGRAIVDDFRRNRYVVPNLPTYTRFKISVRCQNQYGESSEAPVTGIGYSGEDKPTIKVENFRLDPTFSVTDREAKFLWDPIPDDPAQINGFFVGYRLRYYRESNPDDVRITTVVINLPISNTQIHYPNVEASTVLYDLWPSSEITVTCMVLNTRYVGPPSYSLVISTRE